MNDEPNPMLLLSSVFVRFSTAFQEETDKWEKQFNLLLFYSILRNITYWNIEIKIITKGEKLLFSGLVILPLAMRAEVQAKRFPVTSLALLHIQKSTFTFYFSLFTLRSSFFILQTEILQLLKLLKTLDFSFPFTFAFILTFTFIATLSSRRSH